MLRHAEPISVRHTNTRTLHMHDVACTRLNVVYYFIEEFVRVRREHRVNYVPKGGRMRLN